MKADNWFTGIIEDHDPNLGRVKVRMFGLHSFNATELETVDLPWSMILFPANSPSGVTSSNDILGQCAFGFFRDGEDMQDAVVIGIYKIRNEVQNGWQRQTAGGYNPIYNANGSVNAYSNTNAVPNLEPITAAAGGYIPSTAAREVPQTLAGNSPNPEIVNRLVSTAKAELNSWQTGNRNSVKYFSATTLRDASSRTAWCAAFVTWIIQQAGIFSEEERPKETSALGYKDWAAGLRDKVQLLPISTLPQPGDIVVFTWPSEQSHVGIVVDTQNNGRFTTIEGNTSNGNVDRKSRNTNRVVGIIRIFSN